MEPESAPRDNRNDLARALARFLDESGAQHVLALDISAQSSFADCFVIAGASSQAQLGGFHRRAEEFLRERGVFPRNHRKRGDESGWLLLDCDSLVVHLMLKDIREFYDLERLWFDAELLWQAENAP
ncbi:MAG: ribosome silencing factor [Spirochaetaceae bacterium]|nr:MAG: ribosome silencing factor [Spirochaetaceae bacterium]